MQRIMDSSNVMEIKSWENSQNSAIRNTITFRDYLQISSLILTALILQFPYNKQKTMIFLIISGGMEVN